MSGCAVAIRGSWHHVSTTDATMPNESLATRALAYAIFAVYLSAALAGCDITQHFDSKPVVVLENN
jgi:hypothetical protein